MSQNSNTLPTTGTVSGLAMVQYMNLALDTLITNNSGASAPSTPQPYMLWANTTSGTLCIRNSANTAWTTIGMLSDIGIQSSAQITAAAAGTTDAITASFTPAITALTNGMTLYVRASAANATATPSFTPNSGTVAAKTIVKGNGLALVAGDIAGTGHWLELQYDSTLASWVLQNPATGIVGSTPIAYSQFGGNITSNTSLTFSQSGKWFELSNGIVTLPSTSGTPYRFKFVGLGAGGQIKTPDGVIVLPDTTSIAANVNSPVISQSMVWDVWSDGAGGAYVVSMTGQPIIQAGTANNHAVNFGQAIAFRTANVTPVPTTNGVGITASHSLGTVPAISILEFVCLVAEQGYSVGDVVIVSSQWTGTTANPLTQWKSASQVGAQPSSVTTFQLANKTTGAAFTPTGANWASRFVLR